MQQLEVSGTCLESSLFGVNSTYQFSDIRISISANSKSKYMSFSNEDFIDLHYKKEVLFICFVSKKAIQSIVGNVKEVLIQEVGVLLPDDLCELPQSTGDSSYALVFGSKGILALNPTATGWTVEVTTFIYSICQNVCLHTAPKHIVVYSNALQCSYHKCGRLY